LAKDHSERLTLFRLQAVGAASIRTRELRRVGACRVSGVVPGFPQTTGAFARLHGWCTVVEADWSRCPFSCAGRVHECRAELDLSLQADWLVVHKPVCH